MGYVSQGLPQPWCHQADQSAGTWGSSQTQLRAFGVLLLDLFAVRLECEDSACVWRQPVTVTVSVSVMFYLGSLQAGIQIHYPPLTV